MKKTLTAVVLVALTAVIAYYLYDNNHVSPGVRSVLISSPFSLYPKVAAQEARSFAKTSLDWRLINSLENAASSANMADSFSSQASSRYSNFVSASVEHEMERNGEHRIPEDRIKVLRAQNDLAAKKDEQIVQLCKEKRDADQMRYDDMAFVVDTLMGVKKGSPDEHTLIIGSLFKGFCDNNPETAAQ